MNKNFIFVKSVLYKNPILGQLRRNKEKCNKSEFSFILGFVSREIPLKNTIFIIAQNVTF